MLHRTLVVLLASLLLLAGCGKHAADEAQIKQVFAQFDNANNNSDGAAVVQLFTDETFQHYSRLLGLGLNATEQQVRALPGADMFEVLLMRAKASRADLEKLDGRGYVQFATSKGWYVEPPSERTEDTLRRFDFDTNWATAELYSDGESAGITYAFEKVDGTWKINERAGFESISKFIDKTAREVGMSKDEFVVFALEEHLGQDLPSTVWSPMK
jgi:hypothetical protein